MPTSTTTVVEVHLGISTHLLADAPVANHPAIASERKRRATSKTRCGRKRGKTLYDLSVLQPALINALIARVFFRVIEKHVLFSILRVA